MKSEQRKARRREGIYLRSCRHDTKRAKRVVKESFIHVLIQVSNEQVCADVQLFFVRGSLFRCMLSYYTAINSWRTHLVDSYGLSPQFNLVHDLTGIFCVFFRQELTETVALMSHGYAVLWKMDVHYQVNGVSELNEEYRMAKEAYRLVLPGA